MHREWTGKWKLHISGFRIQGPVPEAQGYGSTSSNIELASPEQFWFSLFLGQLLACTVWLRKPSVPIILCLLEHRDAINIYSLVLLICFSIMITKLYPDIPTILNPKPKAVNPQEQALLCLVVFAMGRKLGV